MAKLDPRIATALQSLNPTTASPSWHGAPTHLGLLRRVSSELAGQKPWKSCHCIWQVAMHIAFWENSVANKLIGQTRRFPYGFIPFWPPAPAPLTNQQWKIDLALARESHLRLLDIVTNYDPLALDRRPKRIKKRPTIQFIHGVAEHNLYHNAEIKMIKKAVETMK